MNKIKIFLLAIVGLMLFTPVIAFTSFQVDYSALVVPSTNLYTEDFETENVGEAELTFQGLDFTMVEATDQRVVDYLSDQKILLESSFQPLIDEDAIERTMSDYSTFRERQIYTEFDNSADRNDELGVLHREINEYGINLRLELTNYIQLEEASWERAYVGLEADMGDFVTYYNANLTTMSLATNDSEEEEEASIEDSKIVAVIVDGREDYSDSVDTIEESQITVVSLLERSIEEEDNSLIVEKEAQLLDTIKTDQIVLDSKLSDLEEEKETIADLTTDIKLMDSVLGGEVTEDNSYTDMSTSDLIVEREAASSELELALDSYESTQSDVQDTLTSSITNLTTYQLN